MESALLTLFRIFLQTAALSILFTFAGKFLLRKGFPDNLGDRWRLSFAIGASFFLGLALFLALYVFTSHLIGSARIGFWCTTAALALMTGVEVVPQIPRKLNWPDGLKVSTSWLGLMAWFTFTTATLFNHPFPVEYPAPGNSIDGLYCFGCIHAGRSANYAKFIADEDRVPFLAQNVGQSLLASTHLLLGVNAPLASLMVWIPTTLTALTCLLFGVLRSRGCSITSSAVGTAFILFCNISLTLVYTLVTDHSSPLAFTGHPDAVIGTAGFLLLALFLERLILQQNPVPRTFWFLMGLVAISWCWTAPQNFVVCFAGVGVGAVWLLSHPESRKSVFVRFAVSAGVLLTAILAGGSQAGTFLPRSMREDTGLYVSMIEPTVKLQPSVPCIRSFWTDAHVSGMKAKAPDAPPENHPHPNLVSFDRWADTLELEFWHGCRTYGFLILGVLVLGWRLATSTNNDQERPRIQFWFWFAAFTFVIGFGIVFLIELGDYKWWITRFIAPAIVINLLGLVLAAITMRTRNCPLSWKQCLLMGCVAVAACWGPCSQLVQKTEITWSLWNLESPWSHRLNILAGDPGPYECALARDRKPNFKKVDLISSQDELVLQGQVSPVVHLGFEKLPPEGLSYPPLDARSIEVIFQPSGQTTPHSTLICNHLMRRGITVERVGTSHDYVIVTGDGKAWHELTRFKFREGEWNYLSLTFREHSAVVSLNGTTIVAELPEGYTLWDETVPLHIGNWPQNTRPFDGIIREIRITDRTLVSADIERNALAVNNMNAKVRGRDSVAELPENRVERRPGTERTVVGGGRIQKPLIQDERHQFRLVAVVAHGLQSTIVAPRRHMTGTTGMNSLRWAVLALTIVVNVIVLSPMMECAYIGDDIYNSCVPGMELTSNSNCWQLIAGSIRDWVRISGRFFPFAFSYYALFSIVTSLAAYRILGIVLILINVLLSSNLVTRLTGSHRLGLVSALVVPLMFQIHRNHVEPLCGFSSLLQILLIHILSSIIFLDAYLKSNKKRYIVLSVLFYVMSVLTYEIAWPFVFVHVAVIKLYRPGSWPAVLRTAAPVITSSLSLLALSLILRSCYSVPVINKGDAPSKYLITLNPAEYGKGLAKQVTAALPLSYRAMSLRTLKFYKGTTTFLLSGVLVLMIAYPMAAWMLRPGNGWKADRRSPSSAPESSAEEGFHGGPGKLAIIGLMFLVLPAALIALAPAYSALTPWGEGYLCEYISYFGTAMLLTAMSAVGEARLQKTPRLALGFSSVLTALSTTVTILNYNSNAMVVHNLNIHLRYPRETICEAMEYGLLESVPDESVLVLMRQRPWETPLIAPSFYATYSRRKLDVLHPENYAASKSVVPAKKAHFDQVVSREYAPDQQAYYLDYDAQGRGDGIVILGKLCRLVTAPKSILTATGSSVRIFIRHPETACEFHVRGHKFRTADKTDSESFVLSCRDLRPIRCGDGWSLFEIPDSFGEFDLPSLCIARGLPTSRDLGLVAVHDRTRLLLQNDGPALVHLGFEKISKDGLENPPLPPKLPLSMDVIFKPSKDRTANSTLVSNHVGGKGITIERIDSTEQFKVALGDGKGWHVIDYLRFRDDEWNHLTITLTETTAEVMLNDTRSVTRIPEGFVFWESPSPLMVGNWSGKTRPFDGVIREIRVLNRTRSPAEVASHDSAISRIR